MTQALQTLLDHAQDQRDRAMVALLQREETARRLRLQWDQLQAYHAEYQGRSPTQGGRSAPIEALRSHHAFMQRLDQALSQQQGLLRAADAELEQARQLLLRLETRVASVRKLLERREHEQRRGAQRVEQNRSDEAVLQRRWRDSAHGRSLTH
jgi:flagellar FliJ protein